MKRRFRRINGRKTRKCRVNVGRRSKFVASQKQCLPHNSDVAPINSDVAPIIHIDLHVVETMNSMLDLVEVNINKTHHIKKSVEFIMGKVRHMQTLRKSIDMENLSDYYEVEHQHQRKKSEVPDFFTTLPIPRNNRTVAFDLS